jgi:hypothetical protein
MSSEHKSTCKVNGCSNPPVKERMFCSEHLSGYGVSHVAAHKRQATTIRKNANARKPASPGKNH